MKDVADIDVLGKNDKFPFGKHKGEKVSWVLSNHPSYITWWDGENLSPKIEQDIVEEAEDEHYHKSEDWRRGGTWE